jgi:hypothetical protein
MTSVRDKLPASDMATVQVAEILDVEQEIGAQLPDAYEDFLTIAGCGEEYGGLACWYHFDITRGGNILEANKKLMSSQARRIRTEKLTAQLLPAHFLAVLDSYDGTVYGFIQESDTAFGPSVWSWELETYEFEQVSPNFGEFLEYIAECPVKEIINWRNAQKPASALMKLRPAFA